MSDLHFGAVVIYVDDFRGVVDFYGRAFGLQPRLYDEAVGYAELGADGHVAVASHQAGEMMMPGMYHSSSTGRLAAVEIAFFTDDVGEAYDRAMNAGAADLAAPRVMPWGQTVAYVESIEGTIVGFATPPEDGTPSG